MQNKKPQISLTSSALCGFGLFETMRNYNKKIVYFDKHLKRLEKSSRLIGLPNPYSQGQLKQIISKAVKQNNFKDAYIRLTLWKEDKGVGVYALVKKYKPPASGVYKTGVSVTISRFSQSEGSLLANLKTTSRILYELSYSQAKQKGFWESIILNNRGIIAEASRNNIFFVKEDAIFTPSLSCGCLDGITRRVVFDLAKKYGFKIYEGNFTLQDLFNADEVFLTNSLAGIMPVSSIDKKRIGESRCGRITKLLIQKYNLLLK